MKRGDLAKAEAAARKVEKAHAGEIQPVDGCTLCLGSLSKEHAHALAIAMKLIHRHEKISEREIWARRRARMAF